MRDSQSLLEQLMALDGETIRTADVHALLGTAENDRLLALTGHLVDGDAAAALVELDAAISSGVDAGQLLDQLIGCFRDCMLAALDCSAEMFLHVTSADGVTTVQEIGGRVGVQTILAILQILGEATARLRQTTLRRTVIEVALVRICKLEDLDAIADLVAELRGTPATGVEIRRNTAAPSSSPPRSPKKNSEPRPRPESPAAGMKSTTATSPALSSPVPVPVLESPVLESPMPAPDSSTSRSESVDAAPVEPLTPAKAKQLWEQAISSLSG